MTRAFRISLGVILTLAVIIGGYTAWYSWHRHEVMVHIANCDYQLARPESAPKMHAPDGTMVPVMAPCLIEPVPPSLVALLSGNTEPTDVPDRMKVNPYTFWDVLLGRYSVSPNISAPCDQSATTTDCASLAAQTSAHPQGSSPAVATTTETIGNFTFSYLAGQGRLSEFGSEGVVYPGDYTLTLNGITNYTLFFFTTPAPFSSINPVASSLDDYRTDYPVSTSSPQQVPGSNGTTITIPQTEVRILSGEDVTIHSIPMLRQRYSVGYWTTDQNGQRYFKSDSEADVTNELRYVFFDGETFVVLTGSQADGWIDYIAHTIRLR